MSWSFMQMVMYKTYKNGLDVIYFFQALDDCIGHITSERPSLEVFW